MGISLEINKLGYVLIPPLGIIFFERFLYKNNFLEFLTNFSILTFFLLKPFYTLS
jgi:hypothetical protein